jgi:hypothetical protein
LTRHPARPGISHINGLIALPGRDVEVGEDTEALALQCLHHARHRLIEGNVERLGKMIAHRRQRQLT